MLLAALAISASSPSLTGAAPTSAGMPDGGLTPSQSARDVSELNSPVPVARYDDSDSDVEIITARSAGMWSRIVHTLTSPNVYPLLQMETAMAQFARS